MYKQQRRISRARKMKGDEVYTWAPIREETTLPRRNPKTVGRRETLMKGKTVGT